MPRRSPAGPWEKSPLDMSARVPLWGPGGQGTELTCRCDKKDVTVLERS
jgi:hypothetical protein